MSVLRRAKLRTPDGTESIEYPLGVEAENVEVANQENLSQRLVRIDEDLEKNEEDIAAVSELAGTNKQNIGANEIRIDALERKSASVNKKPYYFDTIADMKAYQGLVEGDMAITLGYHEANDGGGAEYRIINGNYTDDGGSYHELENSLFAELIMKDYIIPEQFGCYGDGIHDDTEAFENLLSKSNSGITIRSNHTKTYIINTKLAINGSATLDLGNATLKTTDENLDFLIRINDNVGRRKISNITIDCNNLCGGIYSQWAASFTLENVNVINVKTIGIHIYRGSLHIRNVRIMNSNNNDATGILIEGTDSKIEHVTIKNCRRGIDNRSGVNYFDTCHVWLGTPFEIDNSIAFNIAGASILTNCYADTYNIGYRIVNHNLCVMNSCRCIINATPYIATATLNPYFLNFVNSENDPIADASSAEKTYLYSFHCSMDNITGFTSYFSNCDTNDVMRYLPLKKISHNRQSWGLVDYWLTSFSNIKSDFNLSKNEIKIYDEFVSIDIMGKPTSSADIEANTMVTIASDFSSLPFTVTRLIWTVPITASDTNAKSYGFANVLLSNNTSSRALQICYIDSINKNYGFRINKIFPRV